MIGPEAQFRENVTRDLRTYRKHDDVAGIEHGLVRRCDLDICKPGSEIGSHPGIPR